ncbi:unnamed protein product [Effrenium voratum]|nr:unnamed protein product [Effrenium voratum]CAJ1462134.1 unnamed protein product [Effrenium voratum]
MGWLAQLLGDGHLPTSWTSQDEAASADAVDAEAPSLAKLEAIYRQTINQVHADLQMVKAYRNSGAGDASSFLVKTGSIDPRLGLFPRPTSHLFYSGGEKKDAQMDNFLKNDAAESETDAADIFEDAVDKEHHAARMVAKGDKAQARRDYAEILEDEEQMEKLVTRAAEDAEEDALLVVQHDKDGKDIDALPYTDEPPEEHS